MVVPFAFTAIIWICVEAGCKNHGWRVGIRVSVTAELPLENECYSDQETENAGTSVVGTSHSRRLRGGDPCSRRFFRHDVEGNP
jgi:hypothetical protein